MERGTANDDVMDNDGLALSRIGANHGYQGSHNLQMHLVRIARDIVRGSGVTVKTVRNHAKTFLSVLSG